MKDEKLEIEFEFTIETLDDVAVRILGFFDYIDGVIPFVSEEKKIFLSAMVCANMEYEQEGDVTTAHYDMVDWNMMCLYNTIAEFVQFDIVPDFDSHPEEYRERNIKEFQEYLRGEHKYLKYV
jgi:hypothetical protein